MELIDKFSAVFVDESEDLIYIYCLRDILIPEDSLGQDCVAGLQIFFRTTFPVPAIGKKNVSSLFLKISALGKDTRAPGRYLPAEGPSPGLSPV